MKSKIITLLFAAIIAVSSIGCATALKSDKIIAVKTRCFGIIVETSGTSGNGAPNVKLGFVSQVIQMIPTSTNQIYAPPYMDTFDLGQGVTPFTTSISEDTGTGMVNMGTNKPTAFKSVTPGIGEPIVAPTLTFGSRLGASAVKKPTPK